MAVSAPPGGAPADTGADVAHLPMEPGPMNTYLLLLHENPRQTAALTPEQNAALVERYRQWASALGAKGQLIDGQKLADEDGRVMRPGAYAVLLQVLHPVHAAVATRALVDVEHGARGG